MVRVRGRRRRGRSWLRGWRRMRRMQNFLQNDVVAIFFSLTFLLFQWIIITGIQTQRFWISTNIPYELSSLIIGRNSPGIQFIHKVCQEKRGEDVVVVVVVVVWSCWCWCGGSKRVL
jgi:hypothetical protein